MAASDRPPRLAGIDPAPQERGQTRIDAARNRALILDAARRLIAERGPDAVSTDDIAIEAGVGKGTVFRRFGSRAGLMMVLLDEDETAEQNAFMFGPPPLGPGAPPLERLLAYGADRLRFVHCHQALLSDAIRDPALRYSGPFTLHRTHVRMLLETAGTTGDLDGQADALIGLLDADYLAYQLSLGRSLDDMVTAWQDTARKLCGH
ncbi:TetR/AcrR family transcriptional regulator [Mycobacterium sp. URHD0025]|uniref:TetR/AcrR family transcriptional regulator n=1 Tax=Mycobacterium sp. URHD0025 TaxID=1298864 RepID=UPI0004109F72|nr:TetR/AcrR family transcriptional regulator [Mycobacterium sp. URHD0025]